MPNTLCEGNHRWRGSERCVLLPPFLKLMVPVAHKIVHTSLKNPVTSSPGDEARAYRPRPMPGRRSVRRILHAMSAFLGQLDAA